MSKMYFPSFEDVVALNRATVLREGGSVYSINNMSEGNAGRLQGILEKAEYPPVDHEMFEGVENIAALLGFDIATGHLFIDGNKRTAMGVLLGFLRVNEVPYLTTERETKEIGWKLADRQASGITREDLADWVRMIVARATRAT